MKHPGGRPTDYNEDTVGKAEAYLQQCIDEEYTRIKSEGNNSVSYDNLVKVKLPSIEGLALYLDITKDTVYEWKARYPQFSDVVNKILQEQAQRLINGGLSGTYNASIAKLILTKHGYRDAQEVTGRDGGAQEHVVVSGESNELVKEYEEKLKKSLLK